MKKGYITYSEAFKMKVVEEIGQGRFATIAQAQKAYGICGMSTIQKWVKKYGRPELLPKRGACRTFCANEKPWLKHRFFSTASRAFV